jgi:hypothetical protein
MPARESYSDPRPRTRLDRQVAFAGWTKPDSRRIGFFVRDLNLLQ